MIISAISAISQYRNILQKLKIWAINSNLLKKTQIEHCTLFSVLYFPNPAASWAHPHSCTLHQGDHFRKLSEITLFSAQCWCSFISPYPDHASLLNINESLNKCIQDDTEKTVSIKLKFHSGWCRGRDEALGGV